MKFIVKPLAFGLGAVLLGCAMPSSEVRQTTSASQPPHSAVTQIVPPARSPDELQVLFWNDAQRNERFRRMEDWFAGIEVSPPAPRPLRAGRPLDAPIAQRINRLMDETRAVGVMVLHDGKKVFESYRDGFGPKQRWTSFSVAKSFTSTLLGAAIRDGKIASLDDPVIRYIPQLAGSAYDPVTVRHLATMTSGVKWNEDYTDPDSDVAQMNRYVVEYGKDAIVAQMRSLKREAPVGTKWVYKTGETNLLGLLVENAVGMTLAEYARDKIMRPAGFEASMFWMTDPRGGNIGGCCLSLRLADYARFGQFVLDGGRGAVPDGWFAEAGAPQVQFEETGFGYGYQWWTYPNGHFGAQGIFGQSITLLPRDRVVVTVLSNWPSATSREYRAKWLDMSASIAASLAKGAR